MLQAKHDAFSSRERAAHPVRLRSTAAVYTHGWGRLSAKSLWLLVPTSRGWRQLTRQAIEEPWSQCRRWWSQAPSRIYVMVQSNIAIKHERYINVDVTRPTGENCHRRRRDSLNKARFCKSTSWRPGTSWIHLPQAFKARRVQPLIRSAPACKAAHSTCGSE